MIKKTNQPQTNASKKQNSMSKSYRVEIKVPFIMTCQVTGLKKVFTSRDFIQRKIDSYDGDIKKMLDTYVCEDAKRLLREGKSVDQVNKLLGGNKTAKEVSLDTLILDRRMSAESYRQAALRRGSNKRASHPRKIRHNTRRERQAA